MMEWYQILSYFLTNGIRIFLCLCLISTLLNLSFNNYKAFIFSFGISLAVTVLSLLSMESLLLYGVEILLLIGICHFLFHSETRMCLFLIFFYEVSIAIWDFLACAAFAILFQSSIYMDNKAPGYLLAIWTVRILMVIVSMIGNSNSNMKISSKIRLLSIHAILSMFGIIALSEQSVLSISDDQLTIWFILSIVLVTAVLSFNQNRQYESEKELAKLNAEQAALLERDYQTLNRSYSANAKLFHDLHNHMDMIYGYLTKGKNAEAIQYIEDINSPIQKIIQNTWTGDDAIDYLINSKIALAEQSAIHTEVNIEFPRHTNIRSADLTAILGNLLDNALEAVVGNENSLRFIHLTIRRINEMLIIKVENGCDKMPVTKNGELLSFKSNQTIHGLGLKSACAAAERYEGILETSYANHMFQAVVTLFYHPIHNV